jgi:hypothetical protein
MAENGPRNGWASRWQAYAGIASIIVMLFLFFRTDWISSGFGSGNQEQRISYLEAQLINMQKDYMRADLALQVLQQIKDDIRELKEEVRLMNARAREGR